ncbi:MAG: MFS transporter [Planctomycetota bacterium]
MNILMLANPQQIPSNVTHQNLNRSLGDAACVGGMVGFGETYFAAFALAAGIGEAFAGIIASAPVLVGGTLQLVAPKLIGIFGSVKRWIVLGAALQAAAFFPLVYFAVRGTLSLSVMLLVASLYWAAGYSVGPAWNAWVEDAVPRDRRIGFFAKRTRLQQITTFASLMVAAGILSIAAKYERTLEAFAVLFALAAVSRLASAVLLHQTETGESTGSRSSPEAGPEVVVCSRPSPEAGQGIVERSRPSPEAGQQGVVRVLASDGYGESAVGVLANDGYGEAAVRVLANDGYDEDSVRVPASYGYEPVSIGFSSAAKRLLAYLIAMQVFIQMSGPFFVPYMLHELKLSHATYVLLIALAFISRVVSMGFWGRVAQRYGSTRLLWCGGLGLVPLAGMWVASSNVYWIAAIQIVSGFAWAAYELGMFLTLFDGVPASQRSRLLRIYNFAGSIAVCTGAFAGAAILNCLGCCTGVYHTLFLVSSFGRLTCLLLLVGIVMPLGTISHIWSRRPATPLSPNIIE